MARVESRPDAVIVQAAVTGSLVDRSTNPNVPITTDEIVADSLAAWRAGPENPLPDSLTTLVMTRHKARSL